MTSAREKEIVTVASIRPARGKEAARILFNEHQAFFTLAATGRKASSLLTALRSATRKQNILELIDLDFCECRRRMARTAGWGFPCC